MQVEPLRIAHVSTFPPIRCGIASFASDLVDSLEDCTNTKFSLHYGEWPCSSRSANVASAAEVAALGEAVSKTDCDVVSLQHEFGIWGGEEGEHLHAFLDKLSKPLVSVLHTTFKKGIRSGTQEDMIRRLVEQSSVCVVLTEAARHSLQSLLGTTAGNLVVIPHGLPNLSFTPPKTGPSRRDLKLITPGFFRENKGVNVVLMAIAHLRRSGWNASYVLAGQTQPQFHGQGAHQQYLARLTKNLGLDGAVSMVDKYLSVSEQCHAIQNAHFGVFAYQDEAQASSGTVPLVMAAGRPAICTPFEYALSKRNESAGVFVANGFDTECVVEAIMTAAANVKYMALAKSTYDVASRSCWRAVARAYRRAYATSLGLA